MKETIVTEQMKRWQKLDKLALLAPLVLFLFLSIGKEGRLLWGIVLRERNFVVTIAALLLLALAAVLVSLPTVLIWWAVSHTMKKAVIQNATFQADRDFDYYREKLTGVSSATISLLMDLQIGAKKDMAALLLKYTKMGAASMKAGMVHAQNQEPPGPLPSDRTPLALAAGEQAQPVNLGVWRRQAVTEAVESGNLKYGDMRQNVYSVSRSCLTGCLGGCLLPILISLGMGITAVATNNSDWMGKLDGLLAAAPRSFGMRQMECLLSSPDMVIAIPLTAFSVLPFLAMFLFPIVAILRTALSIYGTGTRLKKTQAGEILAAQIWGLKNFIRDFSNLAESEKEQLVLWDDFLIYAVVLEENKHIIEDISRLKNLRYQGFILF